MQRQADFYPGGSILKFEASAAEKETIIEAIETSDRAPESESLALFYEYEKGEESWQK